MKYPPYLNKVPKEIIDVEGKSYWKFDYESEEAKELNLNVIQKLLYPVESMTQFFYGDGPRDKFGLETLFTDEELEAMYSDVDYDEE
jgi:hypothetical protein